SRKPGLKEVDGNTCSLAIWGPQVVKAGTGATDSLPDQSLGLAIIVPDDHQGCRREGDPLNYLVQPELKDGSARWFVMAAWDQECERVHSPGKTGDGATVAPSNDCHPQQPAGGRGKQSRSWY